MKHFIYVTFLLMGTCQCQNYKTCTEIPPKALPETEKFVKNSPYTFAYTSNPNYICSKRLFIFPKYNTSGYDSGLMSIRGTNATFMKLTLSTDRKIGKVTSCTVGTNEPKSNLVLKLMGYDFNDTTGSYACFVICNETTIDSCYCYNNSGNYDKAMKAVLQSIANVPIKQKILPANQNCNVAKDSITSAQQQLNKPGYVPGNDNFKTTTTSNVDLFISKIINSLKSFISKLLSAF